MSTNIQRFEIGTQIPLSTTGLSWDEIEQLGLDHDVGPEPLDQLTCTCILGSMSAHLYGTPRPAAPRPAPQIGPDLQPGRKVYVRV